MTLESPTTGKKPTFKEADALLYGAVTATPQFQKGDRFVIGNRFALVLGVLENHRYQVARLDMKATKTGQAIVEIMDGQALFDWINSDKANGNPRSLQTQISELQTSIVALQAEIKELCLENTRLKAQVAELTKTHPKPVIGHSVWNVNNDAARANMATQIGTCQQNQWPILYMLPLGSLQNGAQVIQNVAMFWEEKSRVVEQPNGKVVKLEMEKSA